MKKTLEILLSAALAGAITLGSIFCKPAKADTYVDSYKNHPIALGKTEISYDVPSEFCSSGDWIVYCQKDKVIGVYLGADENRGKRYVLGENYNGVNKPAIDGSTLVYEATNGIYSKVKKVDLLGINFNEAISLGNNLYMLDDLESISLSDNLVSRAGINASKSSYPDISGDKVVWASQYNPNDPNYPDWQLNDEIILYDLNDSSSTKISSTLQAIGEKGKPVIAGPWIAYSCRENSSWKIFGYHIPSGSEFLVEPADFSSERNLSMYYDPTESGDAILAYLDNLDGNAWSSNGIKLARFGINGAEIQLNTGENHYGLNTHYYAGLPCEKVYIWGVNETRETLGLGPILFFEKNGKPTGVNLRTWQEFPIAQQGEPTGIWYDSNKGKMNVAYLIRNFSTPALSSKFSAYVLDTLPLDEPKRYNAAFRAVIEGSDSIQYYLLADINKDGIVDMNDKTIIAENWLGPTCDDANNWCSGADINKDSYVNDYDLNIVDNGMGRVSFGDINFGSFGGSIDIPDIRPQYTIDTYYDWWEEERYFYPPWDYENSYPSWSRYIANPQKHIHGLYFYNRSFGDTQITRIEIPTTDPWSFTTYPWQYDYWFWNPDFPEYFNFANYPLAISEAWERKYSDGKLVFEPRAGGIPAGPGDLCALWALSDSSMYENRQIKIQTSDGEKTYTMPVPMEHTISADLDRDGFVGIKDLSLFAENWFGYGRGNFAGDYWIVNMEDFAEFSWKWLKHEEWYDDPARTYIKY